MIPKTIILVSLTVIFYVGFILYSDFNNFLQSISTFKLEYLFPIFALFLFATFVKGIRQQYLSKTVGISIPFKKNILLHYAGFRMTMTPGGSGELIKTYYLKKNMVMKYQKAFQFL